MAQMSRLRQRLGGYKLVRIQNYRDISYMTQHEIEQGWGVPMSSWYYQNKHRTVQKTVAGHWKLTISKEEKVVES